MENHSDVSPNEFELHNSQVDILTLPIYTRTQLLRYNGQDKNRIFVAIKGYIYDVTSNRRNYGAGKSYHKLVGKDVSRLLGLNRLQLKANESDTGPGEHKEEWDTSDFSEKQFQAVDKWVAFFNKRYRIVGIVVHHQTRK
ncbi:hypothetical protein OXX80_012206 [Metschnikowia pulcherrima]